jgi:ATP diphosphatase
VLFMTHEIKPGRDIDRLLEIMRALRTPVTGCPWDLEQRFETIAPYTIEEAYEVADAIARRDRADLKEELGDLLLQVVYHAQIATEERSFDFADVVLAITTKMIRRHPHVFGDEAARSAGMAKDFWERIKAEEKAEKANERARLGGAGGSRKSGLLADVPVGLPGMTRAIKLQEKAARVGFDWPSVSPVIEKVKEEIAELEGALRAGGGEGGSPASEEATDEFGDLLFVMANLARHLQIDAEAALRRANDKFCRRFAHIEARLGDRGTSPSQSTLQEMDALWDEAKSAEKDARA